MALIYFNLFVIVWFEKNNRHFKIFIAYKKDINSCVERSLKRMPLTSWRDFNALTKKTTRRLQNICLKLKIGTVPVPVFTADIKKACTVTFFNINTYQIVLLSCKKNYEYLRNWQRYYWSCRSVFGKASLRGQSQSRYLKWLEYLFFVSGGRAASGGGAEPDWGSVEGDLPALPPAGQTRRPHRPGQAVSITYHITFGTSNSELVLNFNLEITVPVQ